jgi:hypothetical protein
MSLSKMKLKLIADVNFIHSEAENFREVTKKNKVELAAGEVLCMKSLAGNQMVFMYRPRDIDVSAYGARKGAATVYHSVRLRLSRSTWDAMMLQNYAKMVNIELEGIRTFEEIIGYTPPKVKAVVSKIKTTKQPGKVINLADRRKAA